MRDVMLLVFVAACGSSEPAPPAAQTAPAARTPAPAARTEEPNAQPNPQPDPAPREVDEPSVRIRDGAPCPVAAAGCDRADWAGTATVREVRPSPGVWSGRVATFQEVVYDLGHAQCATDALAGERTLVVSYPIVGGAPWVGATPEVDPRIAPGLEHLLCVEERDGRHVYVRTQVP